MEKIELSCWDTAETLLTEEDMRGYLEEAFREDDLQLIKIALNNVVRARSMNYLANRMGISRKALQQMLSEEGSLDLFNAHKVVDAVGLCLSEVHNFNG